MLTSFIMVGCVLALIVHRPTWQKAVLAISSVPIAILCNLVRLVVTALLFLLVSGKVAEKFFHDFAGRTMVPMAILLMMGEMWIMSRLVVGDSHDPDKAGL
jgi:exosortase/archaeosortase family protein